MHRVISGIQNFFFEILFNERVLFFLGCPLAVGLLKAGPTTIRGGLVMPLMQQGLRSGTIKFNLITARKP